MNAVRAEAVMQKYRLIGFVVAAWLTCNDANASAVSICNRAPVNAHVAIANDTGQGMSSHGWYAVNAGDCVRFERGENSFYYYARATSPLALWLNGGDPIYWRGLSRFCLDNTSFSHAEEAECADHAGFRSIWWADEVDLIAPHHAELKLADAAAAHTQLLGIMEFETQLARTSGEPAFQLGVSTHETPFGLQVDHVWPGTPADREGFETGDFLTALNGYQLTDHRSLKAVLDRVDIRRAEPFSISVTRDGIELSGSIAPLFYAHLHKDFQPVDGLWSGLHSALDTFTWGWGDEAACRAYHAAREAWFQISDDSSANTARWNRASEECVADLSESLEKQQLLYADAAKLGTYAGILGSVGTGSARGSAKQFLGHAKAVPLALRRSRVANINHQLTGSFK